VALGAIVVICLVVSRAAFVGLVTVTVLVAIAELSTALGTRGLHVPTVPLAIGTVGMLTAAYQGGTEALVVGYSLTALGIVGWRLADGAVGFAGDVTAGIFVAAYLPLLAGFAVLLDAPPDGARRVAAFVIVVVCNDVGGYTAGILFGKHPMAPQISPKKSWEGMAGSVLACALAGSVCVPTLVHGHWWQGTLLGIALAASATAGDLGESALKRDLGVKDMGALLPGHGGIMDRLDSLLPSAPIAWLLFAAFGLR